MEYDHTSDLLEDFLNLFENSEDYNVKIEVGRTPNVREFEAHSIILSARSNYFQKAFLNYWANSEEKPIIFKQPNISPSIFEILLKYIYTGLISFDNKVNKLNLVDVIIAADELELRDIVQQLEKQLLQNESDWQFPKDFIKIHQQKQFPKLYNFALGFICRNPKIIFESEDFLRMDETILIQLLKCDYLELKEIEIWKYVINWGIKNTDSILDDDLTKWAPMKFMDLEKTLHNCLPHVRFFQMSSNDYKKVRTDFKNILPQGLDDEIILYFLNLNPPNPPNPPNPEPSNNVLPLRILAYPLESKIINAKDAAFIASWIDKKQGEPYHFNDLPYEFKLIYRASRASREGSDVKNFHDCCDNKGPTVVIIKVQDTNEIIGGYNQLDWRSAKYNHDFYNEYECKTSNSFIFSLTNRAIPTLSRVSSIIWCKNKGPCFGLRDLWIQNDSPLNNIVGKSKRRSYEKKIINRENFKIEEYEVFQIIDSRTVHKLPLLHSQTPI
ncbi:hypothetical protein RirG_046090 [Rhizophagus irregularis DAOM 197198w]|uniref:Serine-enriched protein n=1 Tax=Rhizophagus irregularis (strain DAOM 197198w) TaxID=1432141 RepID=A0A015L5L3_RHIIW|nr:hypothetical protein RirG_046090 [Rhizophagus irregularis DAOM 197198w]